MRRAAKTDSNQADIVRALREIGATVQPLHTVGQGCPDLLVGFRGVNLVLEVKDGGLCLSRQALTADEREWHETWAGQVTVVGSPEEAQLAVIAHAKILGRMTAEEWIETRGGARA